MHKKLYIALLLSGLHCWQTQGADEAALRIEAVDAPVDTITDSNRNDINNAELTEEQQRERQRLLQAQEAADRAQKLNQTSSQGQNSPDETPLQTRSNNGDQPNDSSTQLPYDPKNPTIQDQKNLVAILDDQNNIPLQKFKEYADAIVALRLPPNAYIVLKEGNEFFFNMYQKNPTNFLNELAKVKNFTYLYTIEMYNIFDTRALIFYGKGYKNQINEIYKNFNKIQNPNSEDLKKLMNDMYRAKQEVVLTQALAQSTLPEPLKTIISEKQSVFLSCENQNQILETLKQNSSLIDQYIKQAKDSFPDNQNFNDTIDSYVNAYKATGKTIDDISTLLEKINFVTKVTEGESLIQKALTKAQGNTSLTLALQKIKNTFYKNTTQLSEWMIDQELTTLKKAINKETSLTARFGHRWNNITSKPQPVSPAPSTPAKTPSVENQITTIEDTIEQSITQAKTSWEKITNNYYLREGNQREFDELTQDRNQIIKNEKDTRDNIAELLKNYENGKISQNDLETQVNALIKKFNNNLKRTTGLILLKQVMIYSNDIGPMDKILQRKDASKWAGEEIQRWQNAPLDQLNFDTLLKDIQKRGCLPTKTVTIIRECIKPFLSIFILKLMLFAAVFK